MIKKWIILKKYLKDKIRKIIILV